MVESNEEADYLMSLSSKDRASRHNQEVSISFCCSGMEFPS